MKKGLIVEMRRMRELMCRLCEGVNDHDVLDKVWISYGSSSFDADRFTTYDSSLSRDEYERKMAGKAPHQRPSYDDFVEIMRYHMTNMNKPFFGLWASPVDSTWGWRNFCMGENFNLDKLSDRFLFRLSPDSKIYVVDDAEDLDAISTFGMDRFGWKTIDFRKLLNNGYDGIYATRDAICIPDNVKTMLKGLHAWDVESICVFNKDVIIPIDDESLFPDDSEVQFLMSISHDADEIADLIDILKMDQSQWTKDDWEVVNSFTDDEIERIKERKL